MTTTWTNRKGRKFEIADMDTTHIRNCLAMLRRKGFISESECDSCMGYSPQGEMAQYCYEQSMDDAFARTSPYIDAFEKELDRRNLH